MYIEYGEEEPDPGILINLTEKETRLAILSFLTANNVHVSGPKTIKINGDICGKTEILIEPSGFVMFKGKSFSGRGPKAE